MTQTGIYCTHVSYFGPALYLSFLEKKGVLWMMTFENVSVAPDPLHE